MELAESHESDHANLTALEESSSSTRLDCTKLDLGEGQKLVSIPFMLDEARTGDDNFPQQHYVPPIVDTQLPNDETVAPEWGFSGTECRALGQAFDGTTHGSGLSSSVCQQPFPETPHSEQAADSPFNPVIRSAEVRPDLLTQCGPDANVPSFDNRENTIMEVEFASLTIVENQKRLPPPSPPRAVIDSGNVLRQEIQQLVENGPRTISPVSSPLSIPKVPEAGLASSFPAPSSTSQAPCFLETPSNSGSLKFSRNRSVSSSALGAVEGSDDLDKQPFLACSPPEEVEASEAPLFSARHPEADDGVIGDSALEDIPEGDDSTRLDPRPLSLPEGDDADAGDPVSMSILDAVTEITMDPVSVSHPEAVDAVEEPPAKKAKTNGTVYSGADAVAVVLGQTAEIVLVLAGMAQLRAGRVPTSYEKELAASAYQKLGVLVSRVAPTDLVSKEAVDRMANEYHKRKLAQKRREEKAWAEALSEAEALAKARAEALALAKAEAAARAKAEAEDLERRRQAASNAAALAANGPGRGGPLSSGHSTLRVADNSLASSLSISPSFPPAQGQMGSQALLADSNSGEFPSTEKSRSINGQSHAPVSKPQLGRPPKVRNKIRKDASAPALLTPEFLPAHQNQTPDVQRTQVTHKQLCLGVQQFIREHIPPVSQTLQALPPTYICTPFPCQVCKLIAKDTGSVLVCDSCDEVSHIKCVQGPAPKGAAKGDWNCPKCLLAIRGGKFPSKYGPIRRGIPNSVKLWPPHDTSEVITVPLGGVSNGDVVEQEPAVAPRPIGSGTRRVQRKARLEIDTVVDQGNEVSNVGNVGSSPHLIVHLVNEPSPRMTNPFESNSHPTLDPNTENRVQQGQVLSTVVQTVPQAKDFTANVAADFRTEMQGTSRIMTTNQSEHPKTIEPDTSQIELDKIESQPILVEKPAQGVTKSEVGGVRSEQSNSKTTSSRKKSSIDSGKVLPGKQADVPLPIVMEWVGESTRKADGKAFYRACSVGGIIFAVNDCALFRPETPDVPPYIARLQVLWEDIATSHKWVRVSWCYYPSDIPIARGHPGTTEPDEVYESNHCDNNLVGSIQGPCFVLLPHKFQEETEKRNALLKKGDSLDNLPPIFLSRWMYDAPKGVFKPLQF